MRVILLAAVIGLLGPHAGVAQEKVPMPPTPTPPTAPGSGQAETGGDRTKADDAGATGWGGSWSANQSSQTGNAGTPTTEKAKPLPPQPPPQ
jgi:hypothetical protein